MKIDERIEALAREALAACVGEEPDRFEAALDVMGDTDGPIAWSYAAYVVGYVVNDIFPDGIDDQELDGVAERAVESMSSWWELGPQAAVVALMRSASEGDPTMPGVPVEKVVNTTFVLASYLLQSYRSDDQEWWNYLDEIWNAAEAA
jgi:hypothetical protein